MLPLDSLECWRKPLSDNSSTPSIQMFHPSIHPSPLPTDRMLVSHHLRRPRSERAWATDRRRRHGRRGLVPIILCNALVLWVRVTSRNRVCFDGSHVILYARPPPQTIRQRRRDRLRQDSSQPAIWRLGLWLGGVVRHTLTLVSTGRAGNPKPVGKFVPPCCCCTVPSLGEFLPRHAAK